MSRVVVCFFASYFHFSKMFSPTCVELPFPNLMMNFDVVSMFPATLHRV